MSDSTDDSRRATATDDVSRRQLLRASGGAAAVAAGFPAVSGVASAQTDEEDEQDTIYTDAVLSNSTPKFGKSNFTGLYLLIEDPHNNPDTTGVSSCSVIESDDRVAAYNATISEKVDTGAQSEAEETVVYIPAQDSTVETGNQYVVNDQTACSGGYTSVRLEQVGASSIETAEGTATGGTTSTTEATDDGPVTDEPESETTEASSPGFSALTGVLGVGAAGLAALKRASGGDGE
jgi:hypothetical protein